MGRCFCFSDKTKRRFSIQMASRFSGWILRWLNVTLNYLEHHAVKNLQPARLIIANHVSDLDTLILSTLMPSVFITSAEVRQSLLLGTIAKVAGSSFVERRSAFGLLEEIRNTCRLLEDGFSVILFPEGTSGDGSRLLPFKSALFEAALEHQAPVLPLYIDYTEINRERVRRSNRDNVFYYGDMGFLKHAVRLCSTRSIRVTIRVLPPIETKAHKTRKSLTTAARNAILSQHRPIV